MKVKPATTDSKGVAVHTIVIVMIFGIMMLILLLVFSEYLGIQNCEAARMACSTARASHCFSWWKNDNSFSSGEPDWENINDCDDTGLVSCDKPDRSECLDLIFSD